MQHVVEVRPDLVKLDISLVRGIDGDRARQALVAGMRYFADETDCLMLGEGVETEAELRTLDRLGVVLGQGYLLGRPAPAPEMKPERHAGHDGASQQTPANSGKRARRRAGAATPAESVLRDRLDGGAEREQVGHLLHRGRPARTAWP